MTDARPTPAPTAQGAPLLAVGGLTVHYPGQPAPAVSDASFEIGRGEVLALVGESGSGKSTLARAVAGLITDPMVAVEAEVLEFAGAPIHRRAGAVLPARIPGLTMMFQDASTSLDVVWSVEEQLLAVIRSTQGLGRRAARAQAREWLAKVGLTDTDRVLAARPYELSGGMRQRVMLALALAGSPRLLIADEPTSALDATLARRSMELMTTLSAELGTALLLVSHDIALCAAYSDRTLVMHRGAIVDRGASATLAETVTHPYAQGLLACVPTFEHLDDAVLPTLESIAATRDARAEAAA